MIPNRVLSNRNNIVYLFIYHLTVVLCWLGRNALTCSFKGGVDGLSLMNEFRELREGDVAPEDELGLVHVVLGSRLASPDEFVHPFV